MPSEESSDRLPAQPAVFLYLCEICTPVIGIDKIIITFVGDTLNQCFY